MPEISLGFLLIWALSLAVWVGIGVVIVLVAVRVIRPRGDDSQKILRERLARGEISQADFENVQRILGH